MTERFFIAFWGAACHRSAAPGLRLLDIILRPSGHHRHPSVTALFPQHVANFIFGLAEAALNFSGDFLDRPFGFGLSVAGRLADDFLGGAVRLLDSALDAIFVHGNFPSVDPLTWGATNMGANAAGQQTTI